LKILKLPKIDLNKLQKKKKNNGTSGKKYANPVFDEWKASAVKELLTSQVRLHVIRGCIVCLVVFGIVVASSILTGYYVSSCKAEVDNVISRGNSLLNEHGKIIKDLETYERYADMKLKAPLYVQFAALVSSSKMGFFMDSLSFEQEASLGNLRESFVVETGRNADSVKILGMWKIKGFLMQNVDNRVDYFFQKFFGSDVFTVWDEVLCVRFFARI